MMTQRDDCIYMPCTIRQKKPSLWERLTKTTKNNDSPTISTSTTATNLSSFEGNFGSNHPLIKKQHMEQNLRTVHPEIQALRSEKDIELGSDDTNPDVIYMKEPIKCKKQQIITTISVSLVSCCVGFISAYTSPAGESLMEEVKITSHEYSWIGSLMPLVALAGGLFGGPLIEIIGRKYTIILTNILFIISWILIATAQNVHFIYAGRSVAGIGVGIASLVLPVYLGETLQPEVRGMLGLFPTAFGNGGILLCFIAGCYVNWSGLAYIGTAITVPFFILMFLIPETPRWYVSKGKEKKARKTLSWLRGDADIDEEYNALKSVSNESDEDNTNNIKELFKGVNRKAILISLGLMFFQQFSGINAVIFYTTTIFKLAHTSIDENYCTIILGVVNFISTFLATLVIDRLGRKKLLYISSSAMIITLGALSGYFYVKDHTDLSVESYGWVPLVSLVVYVLAFSLGFGPIPWLMMGEILPAKIRGSAASISTAFNWTCTFVVTKTFANFIEGLGISGTFLLFSIICALSVVFIFLFVPETSGRTLEDIEEKLTGRRITRMSSKANLKPLPSSF